MDAISFLLVFFLGLMAFCTVYVLLVIVVEAFAVWYEGRHNGRG